MKGVLNRLIVIITIFYVFFLFSFYVVYLKENSIFVNKFHIFLPITLGLYVFSIYLILRTSNYIVIPIKQILQQFEKFPKRENLTTKTKIAEIQLLQKYTDDFLNRFSKHLEELNLEKSLLNSLLNNLKDGVLCINRNGRILYINEFVKAKFCEHQSLQELKNQNYYAVIKNPTVLDIIYKVLHDKNTDYIFRGTKTDDNVFEFSGSDNYFQIRHYTLTLNGMMNTVENEKLYLFIINDITQEHNIKRLREDFLQNASHELKTPITSIKGYTETLLDRLEHQNSDKILISFLEGILRNTERMERIINDMVMISSLESRSYPYHPVELDIKTFFAELHYIIEGIIKPKNLRMEYKYLGNIPRIYADPLLLEHLFLNLITNATRYSKENGKIEIIVEKLNNGKIAISVKDYGPGIPDEYKDKIFERFFRIDKDRSRKEGGTGLGLSIVRQIVRIHKGNVYITDNPEGGAVFVVTLPI